MTMKADPLYFYVGSPLSRPDILCDYDMADGPWGEQPCQVKVRACNDTFTQPRYHKQENRPPRLYTTEGGGSVYPHDIPDGRHRDTQWCWLDVAGRVHVNMCYECESQVNGVRIDITIPRPSDYMSMVAMAVACSNRHESIFVHAFLVHTTNGIPSCVDYHTVGEFTFATPNPIRRDPADGMQKFTLIAKKSIVSRTMVPKDDLPIGRLAKKSPFQDCCLGCVAGFGCINGQTE